MRAGRGGNGGGAGGARADDGQVLTDLGSERGPLLPEKGDG